MPSARRTRARARRDRTFALALVVAFALHLPFAPLRLTAWLFGVASPGSITDYDDKDAEAIVPIDLDLEKDLPAAGEATRALPPPKEGAPPPTPGADDSDAGPLSRGPADAGADAGRKKRRADAGDDELDGGPSDAGIDDAGADGGDGGTIVERVKDATEVAGAAGEIQAKDPNVQVLIAGQCLRKHELGPWFGRLLREIPEWNSFFEGTPIDPIKDLAHLLITGPQFRESSKIVAVMDYSVTEARMKGVVAEVVKRAGGAWLTDTKIPAAKAKVEGGERIFALVPGKSLLVVLPASAKKDVDGLAGRKGFSKTCGAGIVIGMKTPSRPFATVFPLPETLAMMRVAVTPTNDGGADVLIEANDKTAELAKEHAADVEARFEKIRKIDLGITTLEVIDHVDFRAEGAVIKAKTHVSKAQLKLVLGAAENEVKKRLEERKARADAGR